ncbi:DUF6701 domain-containing protein [Sideroxydans lithotrophicus]|uniref:G8 domain containing protein n=1 Tax=Sideroxydans lithotrophicus (strain ES-1) TaxID=580332 RepID=D5CNC7_SIDLE|nr:DUF6701 domain-containing protein [Sideroxydans lithotrophicus]ADE12824.1 G8 domain containing protein [Sideroxydans lithotrophicus ES-1]
MNCIANRGFSSIPGVLRVVSLFLALSLFAGAASAVTCTSIASRDWNNRNSWSGCNNGQPPAGATVIIASGTTITADSNTNIVADITINAGGTLVGQNNRTISLTGNFTNNGTFTASNGTVALVGTTMQTISGTTTFANLTLNNPSGVTISGNVTVTGTFNPGSTPIDITAGSTLTINGVVYTGPCSGIYGAGFCSAPSVTSINMASPNPTAGNTAVSWTVVFNQSVTGVDVADFVLVQAGGVGGAGITAVTGSGTTYTVTASTGSGSGNLGLNLMDNDTIMNASGTPLGGVGLGNGNFTGQVYTVSACTPPANIPPGVVVSCVCDNFGRANLNPSPIFNSNWIVSSSDGLGILPYINATSTFLRLTENTNNNAKAATVPGIFPAAGNYISVEFKHYAYNGSGADGVAVTLSDYSVPATPGAFGGSLGYAQRTIAGGGGSNVSGFAGGWIGVALDEYGNYQNPTEGRVGGSGFIAESVGVRGSGSGLTGYNWLGGTAALNPIVDNRGSTTPKPGYSYQVIVDARDAAATAVAVNRDTGAGYTSLVSIPNIYSAANALGFTQAPVPNNWQISFTGSTGGSTNIHEIGGLRICAQSVLPVTGGVASGYSAIDEAYPAAAGSTVPSYQNFQTGHIYMKLPATPFKLWVAALSGTGISSGYSAVSAKYAQVKLVDNSAAVCGLDSARTCNSACTNSAAVEAGATQIVTFTKGGPGAELSPSFTLDSSWKNLIAVIKECTSSSCSAFTSTAAACSADSFSVRPTGFASVTSTMATNTGTSGAPIFTAGSGLFDLTTTTTGVAGFASGYTGTPKINSASVQPASPATVAGMLAGAFSAAVSGTPSSIATGTSFTYSEAGGFSLQAPDFTVPRVPGVYDDSWTATDSDPTRNDCNSGTTAAAYSNTKDANGKYGCNFGITANTPVFGRFVPDHFDTAVLPVSGVPMPCPTGQTCPSLYNGFVYAGQTFTTQVIARNQAGVTTQNYAGGYAKDVTLSAWDALGSTTTQNPAGGTLNNPTVAAASFAAGSATTNTSNYTFAAVATVPTNIYLRAVDTDNVTSLRAVNPTTTSVEGGVKVASGRIKLSNAYGSELLPLTLMATAQYYTVTGWLNSSTDSVTRLASINSSYSVGTGTSNVTVSPVSKVLSLGSLTINLGAPNAAGKVTISPTIDPASPGNPPFAAGTGTIIPGTATFGVYKTKDSYIYRRENY